MPGQRGGAYDDLLPKTEVWSAGARHRTLRP
jgi:hypothetical protein